MQEYSKKCSTTSFYLTSLLGSTRSFNCATPLVFPFVRQTFLIELIANLWTKQTEYINFINCVNVDYTLITNLIH